MLYGLLLWSYRLCLAVSLQIFLRDLEPTLELDHWEHHCLRYFYQPSWSFSVAVDYCLRPTFIDHYRSSEGIPSNRDQRFTFHQLLELNMTAFDLLLWSVPSYLVEDYQEYLNQQDERLASKEIYRCAKPWFGSRCQYAFKAPYQANSFSDLIHQINRAKLRSNPPENEYQVACYMGITCTDQGTALCLDWLQVCDGRIDCLDGGNDEASCFALELNECQPNEYRCHNGLCIPGAFVNDDTPECLDQSDFIEGARIKYGSAIVTDTVWRSYGCRPGPNRFMCDNGTCVSDFQVCKDGRQYPTIASTNAQGNLTRDCWQLMLCLTKILEHSNPFSCPKFMVSMNITASLSQCDSVIQFPTKPILLHHIRFLYRRQDLIDVNTSEAIIPTYVCYDPQLCEHLQPTFHYENLKCRDASLMNLNKSSSYLTWISIIDTLRPVFDGCMLPSQKSDQLQSQSLYCCRNSSKCVSRHRVIDDIIDCPYHDDEEAMELSCSIPNKYRFRCHDEYRCLSPLIPSSICPLRLTLTLKEILFQDICNRIPQTVPELINGQNHTDETECQEWQCSNIYTRCDHFWNCPHGEDEMNCTSSSSSSKCPKDTFACVSVVNYTIICLPARKVVDGVMDCLGGSDEQNICRYDMRESTTYPGFQCVNDTQCMRPRHLCDGKAGCRYGDDEILCNQHGYTCNSDDNPPRNEAEKALCLIAFINRRQFSLETIRPYPPTSDENDDRPQPMSRNNVVSSIVSVDTRSSATNLAHLWQCGNGISTIVRLRSDLNETRCFCHVSAYGDRCQYQSDRVSVTLKVFPVKKEGVQSFFITLISDDHDDQEEKLHSYHQTSFVVDSACSKTFKFFLSYSNRTKNLSSNYFIKIDAFNQTSLTYLGSWRYRIPFIFLPVNPVALVIRVPAEPVSSFSSTQCSSVCRHGRCFRYLNENRYFCRCDLGWTGKRCDQRIPFNDCSPGSVWVGSYRNHSICMCPINTFGRRCLLKYFCPSDLCENGGQCVNLDENDIENYACICPRPYHGILCQFSRNVLQVSFKNLRTPSYLSIYAFFDTSEAGNFRMPKMKRFTQKLRIFQKSSTFYISSELLIVIAEFSEKKYLALVRSITTSKIISTNISSAQECPQFRAIAHARLSHLSEIRRVKYYHYICRVHSHLMCFIDDNYLCLCTTERHANCLPFRNNFQCHENVHCENGAECLQDDSECPTNTFCICSDCFYGDRCQFYAKGIGLTFDDILRFELKPFVSIHHQSVSVKVSAAIATTILIGGLVNSILSCMTFYSDNAKQVGAGIYLLASSIASLLSVTLCNIKFWFLIITQIRRSVARSLLHAGCLGLEPVLKVCLYTDNWLNACVALERAVMVYQETKFNKQRSKWIARRVLLALPILILASISHEFVYRQLFDDHEEERIWCVFHYSKPVLAYSTFILLFHNFLPFLANLISAIFIIVRTALQKAQCQRQQTYRQHLLDRWKEYRHLIISPLIIVVLCLPRVIISTLSGCVKENRNPWWLLTGYFISFIPSMLIFCIFVIPSPFYRQEFAKSNRVLRHRIAKMNVFPW